jgi:hypothetical protein
MIFREIISFERTENIVEWGKNWTTPCISWLAVPRVQDIPCNSAFLNISTGKTVAKRRRARKEVALHGNSRLKPSRVLVSFEMSGRIQTMSVPHQI